MYICNDTSDGSVMNNTQNFVQWSRLTGAKQGGPDFPHPARLAGDMRLRALPLVHITADLDLLLRSSLTFEPCDLMKPAEPHRAGLVLG